MPLYAESRKSIVSYSGSPFILLYGLLFVIFWLYTGFTTSNFVNWLLENTLTLPFLILLYFLYRWHRFSTWSVTFIFIFLMLHVYGSQHTYSENPFGFWLKDLLHLQRNHFDRLVHFGFGFLLAYPMHEIGRDKIKMPAWLTYLIPIVLTLALGALYEIVEWIVADIFFPTQGPAFLGMQGDLWDAQKDMALAVGGALLILLFTFFLRRNERPI